MTPQDRTRKPWLSTALLSAAMLALLILIWAGAPPVLAQDRLKTMPGYERYLLQRFAG